MCPNCHQPLLIVEFEGVALDHCAVCGGIWLDSGELELLLALSSSGPEAADRTGAPGPAAPPPAVYGLTRRAGRRRCPRCRRRMPSVRLGPRPGVCVERCRAGHGLWFDAGEIRALVAAVAARPAANEPGREVAAPAAPAAAVPIARFLEQALRHELGPAGPGGA